MPEVSRFYGIVILFFYRDHAPPHFHVRYNEYRASIEIDGMTLLEGRLPGRVERMVTEWARLHGAELRANWERAATQRPVTKIDPLE